MREILIGETVLTQSVEKTITCKYYILIRTLPSPVCCESYGVCIVIAQTGERAEVQDITVCAERIEALATLLLRGKVTPCTLREIVDDWL